MDDGDYSSLHESQEIERLLSLRKQRRKDYVNSDIRAVRYCEECGTKIPDDRVKAINAVLCIHCQEREENELKRYSWC